MPSAGACKFGDSMSRQHVCTKLHESFGFDLNLQFEWGFDVHVDCQISLDKTIWSIIKKTEHLLEAKTSNVLMFYP